MDQNGVVRLTFDAGSFELQRKVLRGRWTMTHSAEDLAEMVRMFEALSIYPNEAMRVAEYDEKHHLVRIHKLKAGRLIAGRLRKKAAEPRP